MRKPGDTAGRAGKTKPEDREGSSRKLRAESGKKVARPAGKTSPLKKHGPDKLMHELQVHQVELQLLVEKYKTVADFARDWEYWMSPEGSYIYVSPSCKSHTGYEPEAFLKDPDLMLKIIHPDDRYILLSHRKEALATDGTSNPVDFRIVTRDGDEVWIGHRCKKVFSTDGKYLGVRGGNRDITGEKRLERDLTDSEQTQHLLADYAIKLKDISILLNETSDLKDLLNRVAESFRLFTDSIAATFTVFNPEKQTLQLVSLSADPAARSEVDAIFGPELFDMQMPISQDMREELLNQAIRRFKDIHELSVGVISQDDSDLFMQSVGCKQIVACSVSDGMDIAGVCTAYLPASLPMVPDYILKPYLYMARLAIKRMQAAEALRVSEERYRCLVETAGAGIATIDMEGIITFVNDRICQLTSYSREDIAGRPFADFLHKDDLPPLMEQFLKAASGARISELLEFRLICKGGHCIWVHSNPEPVIIGGQITGFSAILYDISNRKAAERMILESEALYRSLVETSPDAIGLMDLDGTIIMHNRQALEVFGFDAADDLTGKNVMDMVAPEHYESVLNNMEKLQAAETIRNLELISHKKDGQQFWLELSSSILPDEEGNPKTIMIVFEDITERKQVEEALRDSTSQYRLLSEHTSDIVALMDMNFKVIYQSPSGEKQRGFTSQEIRELPLEKHFPPESLKLVMETYVKDIPRIETDPGYNPITTLELEYYRKDGTTFWAESKFGIVRDDNDKPVSILAEVRDITERRKVISALRESEGQYRLLADHTTDFIWLMDMNLNNIYVSPSVIKRTGFTEQEMLELPLELHVTPDSLKVATEVALEFIARVEADTEYNPTTTFDMEYCCKDGTTFWAENKFSIIRDSDGKPVSILGEARDITDRRLVEEKLIKSYESTKKTLNDAINTMVKIVELRDPYTASHQQKVADLATAIAREMKLEDTLIEQLGTAAIIHDIGKMYVPLDILSKPGKLSEIELGLIKTHSQSGYDIIKGMDFPCSVANTVLQHHERLDGSGYPDGIKGENTLLEAKILVVADVVEAMASHRPYRPAMGIDKALEELLNGRGTLYDPDAVDTCIELFNSGKFAFKPV